MGPPLVQNFWIKYNIFIDGVRNFLTQFKYLYNLKKMSYECNYCNTSFATLKNLEFHKKNAKYCLNIQGKTSDKFKCDDCNKTFSINHWLVHHQTTCLEHQIKLRLKDELSKHKFEIESLKEQIDKKDQIIREKDQIIRDLAEKAINNAKPSITNNNTTINHVENLQVITSDHLQSQAQHLTIDHIKRGALGYSEYLLGYPLKDRIVCTDYSRRKIKYKNEEGEIVTDPELTKLSDLLFKSIKDRNRELTIQYSNELSEKFKTAKDPMQLSYFMDLASKFSEQDMEVFRMFNGDKNEFFHDIIRDICSKTLK